MRALTISAALLVIDTVLLPATANYEQWEENRKDISYCDANEDTIVSYGDGEYYVCQKMPILIGQEESSKGLWIRWTCDDAEAPFDESVCKPPLEGPLFDPQMKPMMDQMVFCKEDGANEDNGHENIPESLSCDLESSPFIPDADVIHHYYECQSINWNIKCGQWHLRTCYDQQSFDSYTQECKADQQQYEEGGVQMRQAFMSYATGTYAYTSQVPTYGYTVPYAQPAVPMYTYQRTYPVAYMPQLRVPVMPVMPATFGFPMNPFMSGFPMQSMFQYFMSMFPWMYPGYGYGMPPRPGSAGQKTPNSPQQPQGGGGGGGGSPQGGAPSGGGGGLMSKLPGLASGGLSALKKLGPLAKLG